jgi:signal transduction histidine kinase
MTVLNDVARTLSSTLQLDEVLTRIMEQVESTLNVEAGSLLLSDPVTGDLVFQIALGEKADEVKPFRIPKGQGIAGEVALTGKPLMIADADQDKRHFKKLDQSTNFLSRNILCVPLVLYDQIIGVLEVLNKRKGNFTQNDLELLSSIASYAAIAIQNARLHENVLAERDKVIEAEEEARKKLARDLHDGPTQLVAGIKMSLDFSKKALEKEPSLLPKELIYMQDLAERATHQMRTMLFELRPLVLETQGLGAAVQVFIERRQKDITGETPQLALKIETDHSGDDISRQDGKVEATIFAIVQETVNNAIKHAQAENIVVQLTETATAIYTVIKDDGQGFDVNQVMSNYEQRGSLGMINLKERSQLIGGELSIRSAPGSGTRITIQVPKEQSERLKKRKSTGTFSLSARLSPSNRTGHS